MMMMMMLMMMMMRIEDAMFVSTDKLQKSLTRSLKVLSLYKCDVPHSYSVLLFIF